MLRQPFTIHVLQYMTRKSAIAILKRVRCEKRVRQLLSVMRHFKDKFYDKYHFLEILDQLFAADGSNINGVVRSVLNFLFFFFLQKDLTSTKKHKTVYSEQKLKNVYKKHLREKKSLIHLFAFCAFAWLCFDAFSAFSSFNALQ